MMNPLKQVIRSLAPHHYNEIMEDLGFALTSCVPTKKQIYVFEDADPITINFFKQKIIYKCFGFDNVNCKFITFSNSNMIKCYPEFFNKDRYGNFLQDWIPNSIYFSSCTQKQRQSLAKHLVQTSNMHHSNKIRYISSSDQNDFVYNHFIRNRKQITTTEYTEFMNECIEMSME